MKAVDPNSIDNQKLKELTEVAEIFNISRQAVIKWFEDGKIDDQYYEKVTSPGRKGFKYLMDPMGAPEPHRAKWIRKKVQEDPKGHAKEIDAQLYASFKDFQKEHVDHWFTIFDLAKGLAKRKVEPILKSYKEAHPDVKCSYQTYRKKVNAYEEEGILGIAPKWGNRKGDSVIPDTYFTIFKELYLKESRPPLQDCYKKTRGAAWDAGDLVVKNGDVWLTDENGEADRPFPHSRTFQRRLEKEESESDIYLARYGYSKWKRKYANHITRDKSSIPAGYCWVGDHRQLDTTVYNKETGREYRPWLTAWMDFRSGKWISWYLHEEAPNSDHIFMSFKWGLEKYGKPEAIYIDNGRDYLSNDFAGNQIWNKNADIDKDHKAMISLLGINAQIAIPKNAQAKNIEPRFRTMIRGLEKHIVGYTGSKASDRPEGHRDQVKNREILEAGEHEEIVNTYMEKVLNRQPSEGREHEGLTPNELFRREFKKIKPVDSATLKLLCTRTSNDLTIGKNGIYDSKIKRHYWGEWMAEMKGRKVYMRRDIKKYGKAYVFDAETGEHIDNAQLDMVVNGIVMDDIDRRNLRIKLAQIRREERRAREILNGRTQHDAKDILQQSIANEDANEAIKRSTGDFIEDMNPEVVEEETKADRIRKDIEESEKAKKEKEDLELFTPEDQPKNKLTVGLFDE